MKFIYNMLRFWVPLLIIVVGVFLALSNTDRVVLTLPYVIGSMTFTVPLYHALAISFLVGSLTLTFYFAGDSMAKHFEIRKLRKQLQQATVDSPVSTKTQPSVKTSEPRPLSSQPI